jgi:hypothetical protein
MMFPLMSRITISGKVDDAVIPVSRDPLPMNKGATTFPRASICPVTKMSSAFTFTMFAYTPVTFPIISMFATAGNPIPVRNAPFPMNMLAVTFPNALISWKK